MKTSKMVYSKALIYYLLSLAYTAIGSCVEHQLAVTILIPPSNFEADLQLTTTAFDISSRIECSAKFVALKRIGHNVNGFHFNGTSGLCEIGTVSFPVTEGNTDSGVAVAGISKKQVPI